MTMILLAALLLGVAVAVGLRALIMPSAESAARLEQIDAYGFHAPQRDGSAGSEEALRGLAAAVGRLVLDRSSRMTDASVRAELMKGGLYEMQPAAFVGYRVGCAVALAGLMMMITLGSGALMVFVTAAAAVAGFFIPKGILARRIRMRWEDIDYALPELIDLLVVTVEAGLGFSGSLQVASERMKGALAEELRLSLQEQKMGMSTNEALAAMLARCDTPSMRSFVRSILQAEQLGVSLGQIMRNLAREMRMRRRQAAEERAHKAPVKILFPLVFLIFPSIFIVVLYPALVSINRAFGH